jgi:acetylornithine deacetylase/succinyl-diaminopimelate desuccinylase-like protein
MNTIRFFLILLTHFFFITTTFAADAPKPLSSVELLQQMIRFDTSNPPGNEKPLAQFIQNYLAKFKITSEIIESAPGRANLIARLKGNGTQEPFAMLGHLDVVPADPKEWDHPPFEGKIEGDFLYGRGSLDMKGLVALEINTLIRLQQEKFPLAGDVLLILVADEEAGGKYGAEFLTQNYWEKVKARYVINEGSIGVARAEKNLYPIQVAEKGVAWMKLTAEGASGHGSVPSPQNAVLHLINALHRIVEKDQPIQQTEVVEEFLNQISQGTSFPRSWLMRHFFHWPIAQVASRWIGPQIRGEKALNAMIRNTISPTMLQAGYKINVIPSEATAFIDTRILPGQTPEDFRRKLEMIVHDPALRIELVTQSLPNESPFHTPYFQTMKKAILAADPQGIVAPYLSPGGTDSRFFRAKGAICYGLIPFVMNREEIEHVHGKNEGVRISELPRGEKILYHIVTMMEGGS